MNFSEWHMELLLSPLPLSISYQRILPIAIKIVNYYKNLIDYQNAVKNSENFEISAIDFVPDMDLVPRVEVSGGTIYKIVCKKGVFSCHGKELSLCETLTMCRSPIYLDYCEKIAKLNNKEITKIEESSNLN